MKIYSFWKKHSFQTFHKNQPDYLLDYLLDYTLVSLFRLLLIKYVTIKILLTIPDETQRDIFSSSEYKIEISLS